MKKTKELLFNTAMVLLALLMLAVFPTEKEGAIYEDTIRLHILASSDSDADQTVKLKIRDRLLLTYGERLKDAESRTDAEDKTAAMLDDMRRDVNRWLTELGEEYTADVTLTEEWYDTREYEDFTLPCGYYTSLKVTLGEAEGKNWWCVMYPPLCLELATESAPRDDGILKYTEEEARLITSEGYNVKLKILELLSEAIGDLSR